MKFVKRDMPKLDEDEIVRIKEIGDKVVMTKFDKPSYDISQYRNVVGSKSIKILKNSKQTKPKKHINGSVDKDGIKYRTVSSIKKSLSVLKDLIENNFGDNSNEFFLTLKFRDNKKIQRITQADIEFNKFMKKLNKQMADCKIVYICKFEPNVFEGWHLHMIFRLECSKSLTEKELQIILENLWGLGDVYISTLRPQMERLLSYLCDIQKPTKTYYTYKYQLLKKLINEDKNFSKQKKYEQSKKYPRGCHVYTVSKGLCKVKSKAVDVKTYEKLIEGKDLLSAYSANIVDEDGEVVNGITNTVHKPL